MGRLVDADKFLERVKKDREHEIYLHSWTADMVLERLDSWYAPTVEAVPKDQYENRLKADLKAILVELQQQMEEYEPKWAENEDQVIASNRTWDDFDDIIQSKINSLKENNRNAKRT